MKWLTILIGSLICCFWQWMALVIITYLIAFDLIACLLSINIKIFERQISKGCCANEFGAMYKKAGGEKKNNIEIHKSQNGYLHIYMVRRWFFPICLFLLMSRHVLILIRVSIRTFLTSGGTKCSGKGTR